MGLFDRWRKQPADGAPQAPPAPERAPEPEAPSDPPPDVVALVRRGISTPPADYIEAILRADCASGLTPVTVKVPLTQPNWPRTAELTDSTVAAIVRAMAREHGIDPQKASYLQTNGPDGAEVLLVMMWR
ncbi:MAG TPA: hypothetical protein VKN99_25050 [Polyangia bacterium]|nr:hypothetical protein [Polyangia bacterium]